MPRPRTWAASAIPRLRSHASGATSSLPANNFLATPTTRQRSNAATNMQLRSYTAATLRRSRSCMSTAAPCLGCSYAGRNRLRRRRACKGAATSCLRSTSTAATPQQPSLVAGLPQQCSSNISTTLQPVLEGAGMAATTYQPRVRAATTVLRNDADSTTPRTVSPANLNTSQLLPRRACAAIRKVLRLACAAARFLPPAHAAILLPRRCIREALRLLHRRA